MPEDIFRIDTSLDLHQSREIVAPISPCIAIAEIEIAIIHIGPTGNMRSLDVYSVRIIAMLASEAAGSVHSM